MPNLVTLIHWKTKLTLMGNWCPCLFSNQADPDSNRRISPRPSSNFKRENGNFKSLVDLWVSNLEILSEAQLAKQTEMGLKVVPPTTNMMTNQEVQLIRDDSNASDQVRLIMNRPFCEVSRITDNLYLTGVAGLTSENISTLNIKIMINVTYEMPLILKTNIASVRVPVDDDAEDNIYAYFDNVSDFIQRASHEGLRSVVHCVAGASRSSTIVIAYLIKYRKYSLKDAFCYVHACRHCARPNMGFFKQLIAFESHIRKTNSVRMVDYMVNGGKVQVPNFYKDQFPELFSAETKKQLQYRQRENITCKDSRKCLMPATKVKRSKNKSPLSQGISQKVYLKDAFNEINKIRNRSCVL